ncbi:hypothetical protein AGMMS49992_21670 [Clostridia bacterium]|nr:hypothetical protein AGMMS49992_21670 [Clostridia bacterium]
MVKFNKAELRDKIYGCWIGKNIGGTMGTPYEGKRDLLDIEGFVTKPGEVLANDDLDLQLVWLRAVDEIGPRAVNARTLGEYWLSYIGPNWNEYGVGKSNMRAGLPPPISGEIDNGAWKHSNGAWIRTEIWACLYPACVEEAIHYAFEDASVDHGFGEGSYAAIFIAAMESAAFVVSDVRKLIDIGLSKIPEDCRIARSVKLVVDSYGKGVDWRTCRNMLVEDSADLGWFQAPANIGFVILGLLYGEGDFKKSMILAINCGDDTDCTGATLGSILGIANGVAGLPKDWMAYLGDDIVTISIIKGHGFYPRTCSELTDCVVNMLPVTLHATNYQFATGSQKVIVHDGATETDVGPESFMGRAFVERTFSKPRFVFRADGLTVSAEAAFESEPRIAPLGTITGKLSVWTHDMPEQKRFQIRWWLPDGWSISGRTSIYGYGAYSPNNAVDSAEFTVTAGDSAAANSRLVAEITCPGRLEALYLPVVLLGA